MCLSRSSGGSVVLTVLTPKANVTEPDAGNITSVQACYNVSIDQPLNEDAIFTFMASPYSTATQDLDYYVDLPSLNLTIYAGNEAPFTTCFDIIIIGDNMVEDDENLVYNLVPLSEQDSVVFPEGFENLTLLIIDNDGTCIACSSYVITVEPLNVEIRTLQ